MYPAPAYPPPPYWGPPHGQYQPVLAYDPPHPDGYEGVLYGELTADSQKIVLIAEGSEWGLKTIGQRLSRLTPLLETPLDAHGSKIRTAKLVACAAAWPEDTESA